MVLGVAFEKGCDQNQNPLIQTPGYGPAFHLGFNLQNMRKSNYNEKSNKTNTNKSVE